MRSEIAQLRRHLDQRAAAAPLLEQPGAPAVGDNDEA
jgi:hypothetical protein